MTKLQFLVLGRLQDRLASQAESVWKRYIRVAEEVYGPNQDKASPYASFLEADAVQATFRRRWSGGDYDDFGIPADWLWEPNTPICETPTFTILKPDAADEICGGKQFPLTAARG